MFKCVLSFSNAPSFSRARANWHAALSFVYHCRPGWLQGIEAADRRETTGQVAARLLRRLLMIKAKGRKNVASGPRLRLIIAPKMMCKLPSGFDLCLISAVGSDGIPEVQPQTLGGDSTNKNYTEYFGIL